MRVALLLVVSTACATTRHPPVGEAEVPLKLAVGGYQGRVHVAITHPDGSIFRVTLRPDAEWRRVERELTHWGFEAGSHLVTIELENGDRASAPVSLSGRERWVYLGVRTGIRVDDAERARGLPDRQVNLQLSQIREVHLTHLTPGNDAHLERRSDSRSPSFEFVNDSAHAMLGTFVGGNFFGFVERSEADGWTQVSFGPWCGTVSAQKPLPPRKSIGVSDEGGAPLQAGRYRFVVHYEHHDHPDVLALTAYPRIEVHDLYEVTQEFSVDAR